MYINIENIRKLRRDKDFSQDYLADVLGISQSQYSRIESGRNNLDWKKINLLAKFLEVNPIEIIEFSQTPELVNFSEYRNVGNNNDNITIERGAYLTYIQELKDDKEFLKSENLSLKRMLEKLMK